MSEPNLFEGALSESVELNDLLIGLSSVTEKHSIWEIVSNFFSSQNIEAFIYQDIPAIGSAEYKETNSYRKIITSSLSRDYLIQGSELETALLVNSKSLLTFKFWSDWEELDGVLDEGAQGVSVPVFGPRGRNGCFSLQFSSVIHHKNDVEIQSVQCICQSVHQNLIRLLFECTGDLPHLTAREKQILTWIALGKSNADIADILGISFHTVGTYTRRILMKTNTNNRTSAALFGISNALINV